MLIQLSPQRACSFATFNWRTFENISSGSEAASAAACCSYSLSTLEVTSLLDARNFAITERKQPDVWRWAVVSECGFILEEGCEPTQDDAKKSAAGALYLMTAESA